MKHVRFDRITLTVDLEYDHDGEIVYAILDFHTPPRSLIHAETVVEAVSDAVQDITGVGPDRWPPRVMGG